MAVLTISREFGSGGREIGSAVAGDLGYDIVDKERILSDAKDMGDSWERWSKELDERSPSLWDRYDWSFRGFVALMQGILLDYALKDRVVLLGRGGNFLLKDIPFALRVRITAPVERRIEIIMRRETVDIDTARWLIEKTDRERAGFIKSIYGRNWDDPSGYDLTIETDKISFDDSLKMLKARLLERDSFCNDACRNTVMLRREASRVKAGLFTDPSLFFPTLSVELVGESVVVTCVVHNNREREKIIAKTLALAGDTPVQFDIRFRG
jgi:cytidylate kinase